MSERRDDVKMPMSLLFAHICMHIAHTYLYTATVSVAAAGESDNNVIFGNEILLAISKRFLYKRRCK